MTEQSQVRAVLGHLAWIRQQVDRFGMQPEQQLTRERVLNAAMLTRNAAVALQWRYVYATHETDRIVDAAQRAKAGKHIDTFIRGVRELTGQITSTPERPDCRSTLARLVGLIDEVIEQVAACFAWGLPMIQKMPELLDRFDAAKLLSEHATQRDALMSDASAIDEITDSPNAGLRNTLAIALSQDVRLAIEGLPPEAQRAIRETTMVFLRHHAAEAIRGGNAEGQDRWRNLLKSLDTVSAETLPPAAG